MPAGPLLIGDGIENPHNAAALMDAAAMFASQAAFRDRGARLASAWPDRNGPIPLVSAAELGGYAPIVAVDDLPGATDVHGVRLPGHRPDRRPAVVVGNERRGIGGDLLAAAHQRVRIPMAAGPLNCLNVAAAAAVALYHLAGPGGAGRMASRPNPSRHRPELLLAGPRDHVEAGSSIRSAACFGWPRVLLHDREGVWFGVDRRTTTEGRAAARRARNPSTSCRCGPTRWRPCSSGPWW
jgi:SpoU rRNA Methylase family